MKADITMVPRTMIMTSTIILILVSLPGYACVKAAENETAHETSCVASLVNGGALMVFSTSPSFVGVNVLDVVCEYPNGLTERLLEFKLDGESPKFQAKGVDYHGIAGNQLTLFDRNTSRALKAAGCFMDHNYAFKPSLRHKCVVTKIDEQPCAKGNQHTNETLQKDLEETLDRCLNKTQTDHRFETCLYVILAVFVVGAILVPVVWLRYKWYKEAKEPPSVLFTAVSMK